MLPRIFLTIVMTAIASSALAFGLGREGARGGFGSLGSMGKGKPVIQPNGKILLVDGASFILKVDGTSKICRAGGC